MRIRKLGFAVTIIFSIAVIVILLTVWIAGLIGFQLSNPMDFLTTEDGFPTGFTRINEGTPHDGVQIGLGMHMDEVENVVRRLPRSLENSTLQYFGNPENARAYNTWRGGTIVVIYNYSNIAQNIATQSRNWGIAGNVFVGDNIQSVINGGKFLHIIHNSDSREVFVFSDSENSMYAFVLSYDKRGNIVLINLIYVPDWTI